MDLSERERTADFYYHGTTKHYYQQQIERHGRYQHDYVEQGNSVFVSTSLQTAQWYAKDRAKQFFPRSGAVVLKIDGDKVRTRVHPHPIVNDICIDLVLQVECEILDIL
jgi:hypothetical protein